VFLVSLLTLACAPSPSPAPPAPVEAAPAPVEAAPAPAPVPTSPDYSRLQAEALEATAEAVPAANAPRTLLAIAVQLIKAFELWRANAYDDPAGYCTIGHGHLIAKAACATLDASMKQPLTVDDGEKLLKKDLAKARAAVDALVEVELTEPEYGALVSFVFNVGQKNFRSSTLRRLINDNETAEARKVAADQFPRWVMAGGMKFDGLVHRRNCERSLFLDELPKAADGSFDRGACKPERGAAMTDLELIDLDVGEVAQ